VFDPQERSFSIHKLKRRDSDRITLGLACRPDQVPDPLSGLFSRSKQYRIYLALQQNLNMWCNFDGKEVLFFAYDKAKGRARMSSDWEFLSGGGVVFYLE
jgi:hypothetical protein